MKNYMWNHWFWVTVSVSSLRVSSAESRERLSNEDTPSKTQIKTAGNSSDIYSKNEPLKFSKEFKTNSLKKSDNNNGIFMKTLIKTLASKVVRPSPPTGVVTSPQDRGRRPRLVLGPHNKNNVRVIKNSEPNFLKKLFSKIRKFAKVTLASKHGGNGGDSAIYNIPVKPNKSVNGSNKAWELEEDISLEENHNDEDNDINTSVREQTTQFNNDISLRQSVHLPSSSFQSFNPPKPDQEGNERRLPKDEPEQDGFRSDEARGRSLSLDFFSNNLPEKYETKHRVSSTEFVREKYVKSDNHKPTVFLGKRFLEEEESEIIVERDSKIDLLEFTNFLIITIGVFVFILLSSVLVLLLVCQHRGRKESLETSSMSDTSSSCDASQISESTIVSFNTKGEGLRSYRDFDELETLDNDYFLSSLEDISMQM